VEGDKEMRLFLMCFGCSFCIVGIIGIVGSSLNFPTDLICIASGYLGICILVKEEK
jgi:hypothetical protein